MTETESMVRRVVAAMRVRSVEMEADARLRELTDDEWISLARAAIEATKPYMGARIVPIWLKENLPNGGQIWESEDGEQTYYPPTKLRQFWNRIKGSFAALKD